MWETHLLYILPLLSRFAMTDISNVPWGNAVLSQVSVALVFPCTFLPMLVPDMKKEHVFRHAMYAFAFTVAIPTTVRVEDLEPSPLLTFCALGLVTLWWFVLSHWMENNIDERLHTHQGDITVLPLTLVAIATFILTIPTDMFRFTRSTLFYVPIIVAWATMFFLAFQGFALDCVTTYDRPSFPYYAYASLVVSITHLLLIETEVDAHTYQVFPIVAALFCQCIPSFDNQPVMRPRRHVATLAWSVGASATLYFAALQFRLSLKEGSLFTFANLCVSWVLPPVNGRRWVVPGCALSTLVTWSLYDTTSPWDLWALIASHYIVLTTTEWAVHPSLRRGGPFRGQTVVFRNGTGRIQDGSWWMRWVDVRAHDGRVVTWIVPGVHFGYAEHEVLVQTRDPNGNIAVVTFV